MQPCNVKHFILSIIGPNKPRFLVCIRNLRKEQVYYSQRKIQVKARVATDIQEKYRDKAIWKIFQDRENGDAYLDTEEFLDVISLHLSCDIPDVPNAECEVDVE